MQKPEHAGRQTEGCCISWRHASVAAPRYLKSVGCGVAIQRAVAGFVEQRDEVLGEQAERAVVTAAP